MEYGKKIWIFGDGDLPPAGDSEPFGHEALIITNCGEEEAVIDATIYFPDRDPDHATLRVPAERVICFRLDGPIGDENYQIPFGQYSLRLISSTAVVAVFGRLDRRKDCAYYEIDGFSM